MKKAYHFIKGIALKNKLQLINSQQPDKGSILDIGAELRFWRWQKRMVGKQ
jgi:hypothetical protein